MHPHRSMAIFILNKTSRLEPKSQKRVESAKNTTCVLVLYIFEADLRIGITHTGR